MNGFEINKIAGAILLAGLVALVTGKVADFLYHPQLGTDERGFSVVSEDAATRGDVGERKVEKAPVKLGLLMAAADFAKGKKLSKKCSACHTFNEGGNNKVGPNLWNVLNSDIAADDDYKYSSALKAKEGKWDYESMYAFLEKPKAFVKGTKMSFAGFKKPEDIAAMLAFLRSLSNSPVDLPAVEK
jgi:cytochrome c